MRETWAEFLADPAFFVRARPHLALSPLVFVASIALWEAVVRAFEVPHFIAPAPSAVAA